MSWIKTGEEHPSGKKRRIPGSLEINPDVRNRLESFEKRMAVRIRVLLVLLWAGICSVWLSSCGREADQPFTHAVTETRRAVQTNTPEDLRLQVLETEKQEASASADPLVFVYEDGKLSLDVWQDCFGCMDLAYTEKRVEWEDGSYSYCADDYERAVYRIYSLDTKPGTLQEFDLTEFLQESDYRILWGVDTDLYQVRREQGDFVLYVGAWHMPNTEQAFRENGEWIRIDLESRELTALGRSAGVFWSADPENAEEVRSSFIEAEWHSNNLASSHLTEDLWKKNHLGEVSRKIRYSFREQESSCSQGSTEDGKLTVKRVGK